MLVTSALPYANGDIHIGHLLEYIQTDIWVRFQRMGGNDVRYVCADDAHGTPVMLRASALGESPESLVARMKEEHLRDFDSFAISFDNYHSTHSEENRELAEMIYGRLKEGGFIEVREIEELYDPQEKIYLPDRYVRGTCPRCGAQDQYGDSCEACGSVYQARELKDPYSAVSGAKPEWRKTEHHFLRLAEQGDMLREWITGEVPDRMRPGETKPRLQRETRNKLDEWFKDGLRDWDISRNGPYFGFRIPGTDDKYFYVWLDAPIGYLASYRNLCAKEDSDFWDFMGSEDAEMYHFIGKDILYFHALFWPAMLRNSGLRMPTQVFAHGFLVVDGEKMSKSRGTFITARSYVEQGLNPEWLRYYFACKLNDRIEDVDLNLEDFVSRVNSDLVGKLANIPSRVTGFLMKQFGGKLAAPSDPWIEPDADEFAALYEGRKFSEAMSKAMRLAEEVNRRLERAKPWELVKDESRQDELAETCSEALRSFRALCVVLKPVLPMLVASAEQFLHVDPLRWSDLDTTLPEGHEVGKAPHLAKRINPKMIEALLEANRSEQGESQAPAQEEEGEEETVAAIGIADFAKVDLRVAEVLEAGDVAESRKLLRLRLDLGDRQKTVFAGIKQHWTPDELVGRQVVVVDNLEPRKMKFGTSEGMVIAATDTDGVHLLTPARKCRNGSKVS